MDDFEFRVWDNREKKMLYESDFDGEDLIVGLTMNGRVLIGDYYDITPSKRYIPMLFTGLFNAHRNIYEKDIIEDHNGDVRRVKYWKGCYWAERIYPIHSDEDLVLLSSVNVLSKVIGNKFENEKLWEGKE